MTEPDVRILEANIDSLEVLSPRKTTRPAKMLPKPARDTPDVHGVRPAYAVIHSLHLAEGRFFDARHDRSSAPVCVLGQKAKVDLFGYAPAVGKFIKANDQSIAHESD